ncbi:MAG: PilW family protein [Candidatus Hydrothermae bacterium]|nr:PilW family protein [Candidatus Hydrothermae bacterium]
MVRNERGISLIELLVAVAITSVILIGALYVFLTQMRHSHTERKIAQARSEVQVGENLMKRDILLAGYGLPNNLRAIIAGNSSSSHDSVTFIGNAFDASTGYGKWTFVMERAQFSHTVKVRRWNQDNISVGDNLIFLNDDKTLIDGPAQVTNLVETVGQDLDGDGSPDPAYDVTLNSSVSVARGSFAYVIPVGGTPAVVTYTLDSLVLKRNGVPFLEPVEDFQLAYGLDTNEDGRVDLWTNDVNSYNYGTLRKQLKLVRFNILLRTGKYDPRYVYPHDQITLEDRTIDVDSLGRHYRRAVLRTLAIPRNLK